MADEAYELYQRGLQLMRRGSFRAAATVLEQVTVANPDSRSAREALGRAQLRSRQYEGAWESFRWIAEQDPADDYAHFGAGLAASRMGDLDAASRHLSLAVALRPDHERYRQELAQVRQRHRGDPT